MSCQFVAEIGANHDGSLERAKMLIERAASVGATSVKFQHFRAPYIVSDVGFAQLGKLAHHAGWAKSVSEVFRECETPWDWTPILAETCMAHRVEFLSSPYDLGAVDHLEPYVQRWKIGSGEITHRALLRHVAQTKKPIILATGASRMDEVVDAVMVLEKHGADSITLLQCTTNYSGEDDNLGHVNLRALEELADLGYPVGLSDHTRSLSVAIGAVALGAVLIERHFTDNADRTGPDHHFAMEPWEWREMVDRVRDVERALGVGVKDVYGNEADARIVQRRSLRATRDLEAGQVLVDNDIIALRPCPIGATSPMVDLVGTVLAKDVKAGECL